MPRLYNQEDKRLNQPVYRTDERYNFHPLRATDSVALIAFRKNKISN